jgi:catechol 2,3-dioxygenase-like lactoylglutathione lyase family enzyme
MADDREAGKRPARVTAALAPREAGCHPEHMHEVVPTLRIAKLAASRDFYVRALGFGVDWEHADAAGALFAQLSREGMLLYLSERAADGAGRGLVHLYVPNVDAWHAEFFERGVDAPLPQDMPWGNREFRIVDPDGNQLCVCTPSNRRR